MPRRCQESTSAWRKGGATSTRILSATSSLTGQSYPILPQPSRVTRFTLGYPETALRQGSYVDRRRRGRARPCPGRPQGAPLRPRATSHAIDFLMTIRPPRICRGLKTPTYEDQRPAFLLSETLASHRRYNSLLDTPKPAERAGSASRAGAPAARSRSISAARAARVAPGACSSEQPSTP